MIAVEVVMTDVCSFARFISDDANAKLFKGFWIRLMALSVCLLLVAITSGCAAVELVEAGALEIGAEAGLMTVADAAAISEVAEMGLVMRAFPGGVELAAEETLASGPLRASLARLATRTGAVLEADAGAIAISGSHLVIAEEGIIGLRSARGAIEAIGRLDGGVIYEVSRGNLAVSSVGRVRALARNGDVRALASPDANAAIRRVLKPGNGIDVLRVRDSWYEVRISPGDTAWVPVPEMLLTLALTKRTPPVAGPWMDRSDDKSTVLGFVLAEYDRSQLGCKIDPMTCFNGPIPDEIYYEHHPGLTANPLSGRMARVLWESPNAAVVSVKQRYRTLMTSSEQWECESVLVVRGEPVVGVRRSLSGAVQAGSDRWILKKRGYLWTYGEHRPGER
jgi:hypothetical protein